MSRQPSPRVYQIAELNRRIRGQLEKWGEVWVEGEIAEISRSAAGHLYLTLADDTAPAQLRAVMFRGDAGRTRARMERGEKIRVRGRFSLFEPRGALQLTVRVALPAGEGDRREQLERLKKKLAAEGLFSAERKRPLPRLPRAVGVVTSSRGAALHDVIRVATERAPVRIVFAHCLVQGAEAPASIVSALERVAKVPGLEVVILTRGGGGTEDLQAFNAESVARAVAACSLPVVSGVGHEIDSTLTDLVADVRAATPSNAAELVVPDANALALELGGLRRQLERAFEMTVGRQRLILERADKRMATPLRRWRRERPLLEDARRSLARQITRTTRARRTELMQLTDRLRRQEPRAALARNRATVSALRSALGRITPTLLAAKRAELDEHETALATSAREGLAQAKRHHTELLARVDDTMVPRLTGARSELGRLSAQLDALSPLSVLARGYAVVLHGVTGKALISASEVTSGERVRVRLAEGSLSARVLDPEEDS